MSLVAIVGRPNVGKSTLFNRLVGMRQAITDDTAGTTRDRHYGRSDWSGREFSVIDTGGYTVNSDDVFEEEIRKQVMLAIEEADVILFMVEVGTGITDLDMLMADILRRSSKKVLLVVNKVDNNIQTYGTHEFYSLGLGDPYGISSMSGSGTGELMDAVVAALPADAKAEEDDGLPRITIVGRPNVGKSSLTNALLGTERNIVTPVAGTTRDSIHTRYNKFGMEFYLVDTAGLRKKGKVSEDLEFYSVMRSIRSIENSDVCVLMLDASQGIESQDMNIFSLIVRNKKGCVIVVNKWDLIEKETNTMKHYREQLEKKLAPFTDVPIIFTSVINKSSASSTCSRPPCASMRTAAARYPHRSSTTSSYPSSRRPLRRRSRASTYASSTRCSSPRPPRRSRFSSTCRSISRIHTAGSSKTRYAGIGTSQACPSRYISGTNNSKKARFHRAFLLYTSSRQVIFNLPYFRYFPSSSSAFR